MDSGVDTLIWGCLPEIAGCTGWLTGVTPAGDKNWTILFLSILRCEGTALRGVEYWYSNLGCSPCSLSSEPVLLVDIVSLLPSFDSLDPSLLTDIVVQAAPASSLLVDIVDTVPLLCLLAGSLWLILLISDMVS